MKLFEICKKRKHPRENGKQIKKLLCPCANNLLQLCNELGGSINLSTRMLHQNTTNTHLTPVPHICPQKTETLSHIQTQIHNISSRKWKHQNPLLHYNWSNSQWASDHVDVTPTNIFLDHMKYFRQVQEKCRNVIKYCDYVLYELNSENYIIQQM